MIQVLFKKPFSAEDGLIYRPGEKAALSDQDAKHAIDQGAVVMISVMDRPPAHKMITRRSAKGDGR